MSKITRLNRLATMIHLIQRSPDVGSGWRAVSSQLEVLVRRETALAPELYELDTTADGNLRVRLTARGWVLADYV